MTAGELALVVGAVLCILGFAALVVTLREVLRTMREVRTSVDLLRHDTQPLLQELRASVDVARTDLARFDRVLGSAEAISQAVEGSGRVARVALSTPMIKTVAIATGSRRAAGRLRGRGSR